MGLTESLVLSRRYCWISADFRGLSLKLLLNYYEESHYRFRVGDMIIDRIFGMAKSSPDGFGILVTAQNVEQHLEKQKSDLDKYLKKYHLQ